MYFSAMASKRAPLGGEKNKKTVLLLFPKTEFDPLKPRMPSSLVYLGTELKNAGYEPVIVDTRVESDYLTKIKRYLPNCLMVGLTTMTGMQIVYALELAKLVRQLNPAVPIVWGGVHPSIMPNQVLESSYADIISRHEGDKTIVLMAEALSKGKGLEKIPSISFKKNGQIISTPEAELLDVNILLPPDWTLIEPKKYRIFDVQSARGCPHRCEFCYNIMFNKQRWRAKSAEKVVNEIEQIIKGYGVKEINFIDDNFFTHRKRAEEMLDLILKRKLKFTWRTNCRANYFDNFDESFLRKAYSAGLREVQIGCESGSQRILDYMKKDITVKQIINAVTLCRNAGMQAQCSFMIGMPIETARDNRMTFDLIDQLREIDPHVLINMIAIYTPYPGAPLFETAKKYGFQPPQSLEGWGKFSYTQVNVPWIKSWKRREYESIAYISRFLFFKEEMQKRFITKNLKMPFEILSLDAKLRWKLRFFKLPLEWMLVKYFILARKSRRKSRENREEPTIADEGMT